jgi:ribosomal protein L11 methyltransferase
MDEWIEVVLTVPATVAETVGFVLAEMGSEGVTLENRELDTFVPPDPEEMVSETLALRAYFPQPDDSAALLSAIHHRMCELAPAFPGWEPQAPSFTVVRNEDWAEGWKQHFPTTRISRRLLVRPSWEAFTPQPDDVVIEIDPGMAFGTGTHGTTRLCLEAVAAAFESEVPPRCVLDVGTGSGILAIAAAAYGAEEIVACDIDPEACAIAFENAILNHVDEKISFTIAPLEELEGSFDLVLANILAEENIRLADALLARLAPGGRLVLSGILIEKEEMVINAFKSYGLGTPEISHNEDWSCLLYRRP